MMFVKHLIRICNRVVSAIARSMQRTRHLVCATGCSRRGAARSWSGSVPACYESAPTSASSSLSCSSPCLGSSCSRRSFLSTRGGEAPACWFDTGGGAEGTSPTMRMMVSLSCRQVFALLVHRSTGLPSAG